MKKSTNILIFGAIAVALFMFKDKLGFGKKSSADESDDDKEPMSEKEKEKKDAVIDMVKSGLTLPQAVEKAKEVAQTLKDANVVVKTPANVPNVTIRTGKKKKSKKTGKGKAKAKRIIKQAESIFTKYYPKQSA